MIKKSNKSTPGKENASSASVLDDRGVLLNKWKKGIDLRSLVDLLHSESSSDRLQGAYYLGELGVAVEDLMIPATQLAKDPVATCRRAFVAYMMTSGFYNKSIANSLAECLQDLDLYVRVTTIKWAVEAPEDVFEDFSLLVKSGVGGLRPRFPNPLSNEFWIDASLKRAVRGLNIAIWLRSGEKSDDIRKRVPEEDSFVLDELLFSETQPERYSAWKKSRSQH
ncbi:MAG: hypothetical protein EOS26_24050 [Mesorhizobium sp.]|nr:MAG: hypothetical protein EOS26_24050 [Mesorhizobium sp.]